MRDAVIKAVGEVDDIVVAGLVGVGATKRSLTAVNRLRLGVWGPGCRVVVHHRL
jgi:hypothetical protein